VTWGQGSACGKSSASLRRCALLVEIFLCYADNLLSRTENRRTRTEG
jgi:hypothetical protein